jgi:lysophospholipase L1-like esterase
MKKLFGLAILALAGLWLNVGPLRADEAAGLAKTRAKLAAHEPVTIVCLGDSVTGIYYHTGGRRAYPELVAIGLKQLDPQGQVSVINAGLSGHSTVNGLQRLQKDVLDHHPTLVTVMFGLNDMVRVPIADFEANLTSIIGQCRATGAEVLLCTPNGVMETSGRPIARLKAYNAALREVGEKTRTPVCDIFAAYESVRSQDPLAFRLFCSDEIHPNMDGHKLNAETLCKSITGKPVSLKSIEPPQPGVPKTRARLAAGQPVRVLAMAPFDQWIGPALKQYHPAAQVTVTVWPTEGQSLTQLHAAAKTIRAMPVDLVLIAVPLEVTPPLSKPDEAAMVDHSWILNYALSFGLQEWDVIGIAPAVLHPQLTATDQDRENFARRMILAQDLSLVARPKNSAEAPAALLAGWLKKQLEP